MPKRRDILAIVLIVLPWTLLITVWHQSAIAPLLAIRKGTQYTALHRQYQTWSGSSNLTLHFRHRQQAFHLEALSNHDHRLHQSSITLVRVIVNLIWVHCVRECWRLRSNHHKYTCRHFVFCFFLIKELFSLSVCQNDMFNFFQSAFLILMLIITRHVRHVTETMSFHRLSTHMPWPINPRFLPNMTLHTQHAACQLFVLPIYDQILPRFH